MASPPAATNMELTTKLFPQYLDVLEIIKKLDEVLANRIAKANLNWAASDAFIHEIVKSNQIRVEILDFETEQRQRLKHVVQARRAAQGVISKEAIRAQKARKAVNGSPTHELGSSRMNWEVDSNSDETEGLLGVSRDELAKAERTVSEMDTKLDYEAMLHIKLQKATQNFTRHANLASQEVALWVLNTDIDSLFKLARSESQKLLDKVFARMLEEVKVAKAKEEGLLRSQAIASFSNEQPHSLASSTEMADPSQKGSNLQEATFLKKRNFCEYCQKSGHTDALCRELKPEEEKDNYCELCQIEGHWEGNCFRRHPEIKAKFVQEREKKAKNDTCELCGAVGMARKWCWKLHGDEKLERQQLPAVVINSQGFTASPGPATEHWMGVPKFCFACNSSTHADKDCNIADIPVTPLRFIPRHDTNPPTSGAWRTPKALQSGPVERWVSVPSFCFTCKSSGHTDKDCTAVDISKDLSRGADQGTTGKERAWAKAAK